MRVLRAQNPTFTMEYFNHEMDLVSISLEAKVVLLSEVAPAMDLSTREGVPGFHELESDILVNGLRNPIVIIPNFLKLYELSIEGLGGVAPYDVTKDYLCIFGNQRLQVAVRNEYTAVEAFYCEDVNTGILVGKLLES